MTADPRVAVSAINDPNKMQGSHVPAQHRLSSPNGRPIPTVDLSKLSGDAELGFTTGLTDDFFKGAAEL